MSEVTRAGAATPTSVETAESLGEEVRGALRRQVLTLADSKRLLGIRYSDWLLGGPSLEADIATASMAQDEWGHARLLYAMLKDFGDDPTEIEHDRPAEAYASIDPLDEPFGDWADVVAGIVVIDGALTTALASFGEGRYEPARQRAPKMVTEERFHRDLGAAWMRALAGGSDEGRARIREACEAVLPRVLGWLAPEDDAFGRLVSEGLVASAADVTDRFSRRVAPLLEEAGIRSDALVPDRSTWDEARGRGSGHPSEEAVERARGDRNRALFVE